MTEVITDHGGCIDKINNDYISDVKSYLQTHQPLSGPGYVEEGVFEYLRNECKVLVIGAGGLGCEIVKGLVFSGFTNISIIDMDNIEVSNLNRQFLFRPQDVGRSKSLVVAEYMNRNFSHLSVKVEAFGGRIQERGAEFYQQFNLIVSGLDNIEARRWINSLLHSLVEFRNEGGGSEGAVKEMPDTSTVIPLLDGGTEGFKGQSRVILPFITSCFDCSLETFPPKVNYPLCTITETPRLPEHCIEYSYLVEWEKTFPGRKPDFDSSEDVEWIYVKARNRGELFGIEGVTLRLTLGVLKRIIPAIASTNALIAASLVSEALKLSTYCGPTLNNYMMYMGNSGLYIHKFNYEKSETCLVCNRNVHELSFRRNQTLNDLIQHLKVQPNLQLQRPSISSPSSIVYIQNPEVLRKQHTYKLNMSLKSLIQEGVFKEDDELIVTDSAVLSPLKLKLRLTGD